MLRPLGAARGCERARGDPRACLRRTQPPSATRAAARSQCDEQPAGGAGRAPRRPRGHRHAAALRDGDRLHGGVPARGGDAAVHAVRPRGAGVPAAGQRGRGGDVRRELHRQRVAGARPVPMLRTVVGVGGAGAQADLSWEAQRGAGRGLRAGGHAWRRRRGADLHQRHHRAQGRPDPAPGAGRQPAGFRLQPELVRLRPAGPGTAERRRLLVARGLARTGGLYGRAAAQPLLRPAHRRLQRALRRTWPSR